MVDRSDGWPRLDESVFAAMPEDEQAIIRRHEEEMIAASKLQLADICDNCHIKPQFAKTYRVLRRDRRKMLEKGRARLAQPDPELSDAFGGAMIRSTDAIVSYKLRLMASHFYARWGEPIEDWAGKEGSAIDKAGCCVFFLVAGPAVPGALLLFRWLIA